MPQPVVIDVHSHAVFPTGQQTFVAQQPDWSPEGAIALMDQNGISCAIISVPDAANFAEGQAAVDIAREINDKIAEMVAKYPTRFGGMATLPGRNTDGILREIEYALDTLKLDGLSTTTSINDVYLGDRRFDPWFEEMNRRSATLFIHPTKLSTSERTDLGINVAALEFMFDSTRMLTNMLLEGTKKRYSDIKMISTHAGGTIPFLAERIETLVSYYGAGRDRSSGRDRAPISGQEVREVFSSFYYDLTASTSHVQLTGLLDLMPASQLLMGFDIPYMPTPTFRPAIERVQQFPGFSPSDREMIAHGNAARLYPRVAARLGLAAA